MAAKVLAFELKINGVKAQTQQLDALEKQLKDIRTQIDAINKSGKGFSDLTNEERKLTKAAKDTKKAIAEKNKEFAKELSDGAKLARERKAWAAQNRDMLKAERAEAKVASARRKQDVAEAIRQDEIKKGSLIGMRSVLNSLQREYDQLSAAERKAARGAELLTSIQKQHAQVMNLEASTRRYQRNVGNYPQAVGLLASNLTGGIVSGTGQGAFGLGGALSAAAPLAIATGITLLGKKFIQINKEIDDVQANVRKTTGLNVQQVEALTEGLSKLKTPTTLVDLLNIATEAGRLGVSGGTKALQEFTAAIDTVNIALGDEFQGGASEITTVLGKLSNVLFGASHDGEVLADRFGKIGNALNVLANAGTASAGEIADLSSRISGTGRAIGLTQGEILGISSAIVEMGINVERGAGAFNRLNSVIRARYEDVAKAIGLPAQELKTLLDTKPIEALDTVIESLFKKANGSTTELTKELKALGISGVGINEMFQKWAQNQELINERTSDGNIAIKNNNSLLSERANMLDTISGKWSILKNELTKGFISSKAQDAIKGFLDGLTAIIKIPEAAYSAAGEVFKQWATTFFPALGLAAQGSKQSAQDLKDAADTLLKVRRQFANVDPNDFFGGKRQGLPRADASVWLESVKESNTASQINQDAKAAAGSIEDLQNQIQKLNKDIDKSNNKRLNLQRASQVRSLEAQVAALQEMYKGATNAAGSINDLQEQIQKLNAAIEKSNDTKLNIARTKEIKELQEKIEALKLLYERGFVVKVELPETLPSKVASGSVVSQKGDAKAIKKAQDISQHLKTKKKKKDKKDKKDPFIVTLDKYVSKTGNAINQLLDLWGQYYQNVTDKEIDSLDRMYQSRIEAAKGNATLEEGIRRELEDKKYQISKEAHKKQQAIAVTQAIISGAQAVISAAATTPFIPAGIIAAGVAAAMTAAQIAVIKSQSFAKGGYTGDSTAAPDHTGHRPVGVVHDGEFVFTKEKTKKYRPLFEAIHNGYATGGIVGSTPNLSPTSLSIHIDKSDMLTFAQTVAAEAQTGIYSGVLAGEEQKTRMIERRNIQQRNSQR